MGALYIRARLVNALRRRFPHPAVVAKRERRRVAAQASCQQAAVMRTHVLAVADKIRREVQG